MELNIYQTEILIAIGVYILLGLSVFVAMSTQWRVGMAGATGLDYGVLPVVMRLAGVRHSERDEVFRDLRIMEDAALTTMRANK